MLERFNCCFQTEHAIISRERRSVVIQGSQILLKSMLMAGIFKRGRQETMPHILSYKSANNFFFNINKTLDIQQYGDCLSLPLCFAKRFERPMHTLEFLDVTLGITNVTFGHNFHNCVTLGSIYVTFGSMLPNVTQSCNIREQMHQQGAKNVTLGH